MFDISEIKPALALPLISWHFFSSWDEKAKHENDKDNGIVYCNTKGIKLLDLHLS